MLAIQQKMVLLMKHLIKDSWYADDVLEPACRVYEKEAEEKGYQIYNTELNYSKLIYIILNIYYSKYILNYIITLSLNSVSVYIGILKELADNILGVSKLGEYAITILVDETTDVVNVPILLNI